MAGLIHPENFELWTEWSRSQHRLRRAKHAVTDTALAVRHRLPGGASDEDATAEDVPAAWVLRSRQAEDADAGERRILFAVDSGTPTSRAALLSSLLYQRVGVDVLAPGDVELPELDGEEWTQRSLDIPDDAVSTSTGAIVSIGQHLAAGAAAHRLARRRGIPEFVVQHGALTPYAPPLPYGATLLAWSAADGEFWRSDREDVSTIDVGSQLLWQAAHESPGASAGTESESPVELPDPERPIFLGQLHGAELSRRLTGGAAVRFCKENNGLYRPHPAETDVLSRTQHRLWQRRGLEFAATDVPLRELPNPVVSVFSTGVLETAARGGDAWVFCPGAPGWVKEMWHRYDMRQVGGAPTPSPVGEGEEPAARIARVLEDAL